MDERAAGAAVAVGEGVDRLELSVSDCCLHESRMVIAVDVVEEVVEQGLERVRWRWDEGCGARVVAAATDPVLHCADHTADVRHRRSFHQGPVDTEQVVEGDRVGRRAQLDSGLHGCDVGEHLDCDPVGCVATLSKHDLCVEQAAWTCLQSLDLRGGDRLGAQQEPRQPFEADMRCSGRVQPANGGFGVAEVGDEIGGEDGVPPGERVGEVGVVVATLAVAATHPLERGGPAASDQCCHNRYLPSL
jgi:hypothetical protein